MMRFAKIAEQYIDEDIEFLEDSFYEGIPTITIPSSGRTFECLACDGFWSWVKRSREGDPQSQMLVVVNKEGEVQREFYMVLPVYDPNIGFLPVKTHCLIELDMFKRFREFAEYYEEVFGSHIPEEAIVAAEQEMYADWER